MHKTPKKTNLLVTGNKGYKTDIENTQWSADLSAKMLC